MRVFLDTEFTDFHYPRLISFGLVAEEGREFYGELADGWALDHCSEFVRSTVLPLLDGNASTRDEAGARLVEWLASLDHSITIVSDTETDWRLLVMLIYPHVGNELEVTGELLSLSGLSMARRHEDFLEEMLANDPGRHHALVDARALQKTVLQTEAEFRAGYVRQRVSTFVCHDMHDKIGRGKT